MKAIKKIGLVVFIASLAIFTSLIFVGSYNISENTFSEFANNQGIRNKAFIQRMQQEVVGENFTNTVFARNKIATILDETNQPLMDNGEWGKVFWDKPSSITFNLLKESGQGPVSDNKELFLFLTFALGIIGALMFILPNVILLGSAGIKNNNIYHKSATNRGWLGWVVLGYLVGFYILLYFSPYIIVNWVFITEPVSQTLFSASSSQWFLYGLLYCITMIIMGIRMYIKYRHNKYQIVRTTFVLFFQIVFAFLLVNILPLFNLPGVDLKNAWPLDYTFLFDYKITPYFKSLDAGGYVKGAIFILFWGVVLAFVVLPLLVYFFGKRWYCSWVCGCGGLAETLGDPYRQLSNKTLNAWKFERWMIHAVLIFALIMTVWTGIHSYREVTNPSTDGNEILLGLSAFDVRSLYGFLIGSIFSGVIGTGFYPIFGSRVWCRFGCPLAAYMGIIQKFKSRFRITTNGGQCISCGNCSTYCEMGIDVKYYAQRGQNIVRASCVGCGICSAVCPRGVLKLENGPIENRTPETPILLGNNSAILTPDLVEK